jgi:transforming growth factor-beta-induced protein
MKGIRFAAIAAAAVTAFGVSGVSSAKKSPVPGKPGDANIVEIAGAVNATNGEFSYLLAAATCDYFDGAIVALLTGEDKLTLFAPTDDAFIALQTALIEAFELDAQPSPELSCAIDSLLGEGTLFNVLAYHVTEGRRFSNSVFNRNSTKMVEMLNGQYIVTNPDLTINDIAGQSVGVVPSLVNINASNGVIHVISTVLLPL